MKQPDACVVRITDAQGKTLGTGFLVSTDGLIVTCAHVVKGTEPCVAFPGGEPQPAQVVATDPVHDVAILRVEGELPDDAEPARLCHSTEAYHREFWSRGYRPLEGLEGIPAKGEVLDAVSECLGYPDVRHMPLVLDSPHIREGMSGAPVYIPDWDLVVGMVTSYWDSLKAGTGFADRDTALATPAEAFAALCPDVRLCEPPPELSHPPLGVPFQAPAVPRYFVPRPEVSNDLKARLLAEEATAPGALVVSAVHGLGGIGKTTLVAALTHDPDLQARFPDGVLWTTLGQQPDVLSLLVGWIQALRDYDFRPIVVESASNHLRTLLHDKACLLVVDDAWQADHVRPFLVGGERCRMLITTRDATLARKVGAFLHDLDVMTEAQALALFQARLGPLDGDREQAAALARELGHLPLALELAAAQVEAGLSWDELLDTFRRELADLAALDLDEATCRNESLRLSFRLSLEQLSPDDREAFAWLGVLPEDVRLNPAMAATLWDQLETGARKRLRRLRDRALLKPVGDDCYTLHDLLHDEAKLRLAEQVPLPEAHAALLDRYRRKVTYEQWHRLPDDGYIHEYLTWHMGQARQAEAIHALLRLETEAGRNAWYEAREALGQTAGYLDDVRRVWQLSEEEFALRPSPFAIALQCRYALTIASLSSLAGNLPAALPATLVKEKIWSPAQGLANALQMPELRPQAEALGGLAPHLPEALLQKALAAVREIGVESQRARTLAKLVPYLPEALLTEALAAARALQSSQWRAVALAALAPHLPESLLREALAAAWALRNLRWRAAVLTRLASYLPEAESAAALREALAAARKIRHPWYRAKALAALAPHLSRPKRGQILLEALATARATTVVQYWARALSWLAPRPLEPERAHALRQALTAKWEIEGKDEDGAEEEIVERDHEYREVLSELTPHLKGPLLREVLAAFRELPKRIWAGESPGTAVLYGLALQLPEPLRSEALQEALTAARAIEDSSGRAQALSTLAPYLPGPLREETLRETLVAVRTIGDMDEQAWALVGLAPHLPEPLLRKALAMSWELPAWIPRSPLNPRAEALARLAPYLPDGLLRETLGTALAIEQEWRRAEALAALAPHLPEALLREALTAALAIEKEWRRTEVLAALAPHLPEALLKEALTAALAIENQDNRARVLVGLVPRLAEVGYPEEALVSARKIENKYRRAEALARLAPRLAKLGYPEKAMAAARMIRHNKQKAEALARLASHLPEALLREALAAARALRSGQWRAEALAALASHLPEAEYATVLQQALAAARAIRDAKHRMKALTRLARHLPEAECAAVLQEALATAWEIQRANDSKETLAELASHLAELGYPQEALAAAWKIESGHYWAKALTGLAPHLAALPPDTLYPLWRKTLHTLARRTRKDLLFGIRALEPVLAALGGEQAAVETARAIQDVGRWWP